MIGIHLKAAAVLAATRTGIAALGALVIASCGDSAQSGGGDAPASASSAAQRTESDDSSEFSNYRLSMSVLTRIEAASRSYNAAIKSDPAYQAFARASQEYSVLNDNPSRTDAEEARMEQLQRTIDANPFGATSPADDDGSLDEAEADIAKMPQLANALRAQRVSPRDYVKFMTVLVQSSMVAGFQASAASQGSTPDAQMGALGALGVYATPENVRFVTANQTAAERLLRTMVEFGQP